MTHIKNDLSREERLARLALLSNVGQRLYGKRWHDEMAARLGVRSRTLRRWLAMQWDIPDEINDELRRAYDAE